jgi:predicted phosphate transport protein (TIGR00153 family)
MWKKISSFPLRGVEENLSEHLKLVFSSVQLLNDLIAACESDNWTLVSSVAERIAMIEREADDVKRKVELDLYRGAIFVGLKEDFLALAESVDSISDKAKEASRALATRKPDKAEIDLLFECRTDIKKMISGTVDIVKLLELAISLLNKNANEALKKAHEVEKM